MASSQVAGEVGCLHGNADGSRLAIYARALRAVRTVTLTSEVTLDMIVLAFYTPVAVRDVDDNWWWLAGVNADGSLHLEAADI